MTVLSHEIKQFRNIRALSFQPGEGLNILFGNNGQGKTNILESLWLYSGCHSFRTKKTQELIRDGEQQAVTKLLFFSSEMEQSAEMQLSKKREVLLNGVKLESPRKLLGTFPAVVFSPEVLAIVKDGPAQRRRFLDIAISLMKPNYAHVLAKYMRTMEQRNALLRQLAQNGGRQEEYLQPWDEELALLGARIMEYRAAYVGMLCEQSREAYGSITRQKEVLGIAYESAVSLDENQAPAREELAAALLKNLQSSRETDIRRRCTNCGIHKEDLRLEINGLPARSYGSQGQQRSCALALKIGEAQLLCRNSGENPIVLLDDVMSELDEQRQKDVLECLAQWQVFVTCCEPSQVLRLKTGKTFEVCAGEIWEA